MVEFKDKMEALTKLPLVLITLLTNKIINMKEVQVNWILIHKEITGTLEDPAEL